MAVVAFDTYEVVKELRAAGFDEAQAAALTAAVKRAQQVDLSELATKSDFSELRQATKADLNELKLTTKSDFTELRQATKADIADVRREIAELKAEIASKLLTVVGVQTVVILGALVGLFRLLQP